MTKKDVLELKRRLKKNECTFTKLCGCYVNADKDIILNLEETFLNLEEEEFYKYLEIARKTLSGNLGNNLLELEFPMEEEATGGKQQFLMGLRESKLKNSGLLESFYQLIIDHYDYAGNYLILVFHDTYDVITKTNDNLKLDESEEVYEYLLCAICPVSLSKPGLGYLENENRIGARIRDWIVEAPDSGFLFPAFTDRSSDIHSIIFYTKDTKEPHIELIEEALGCPSRQTATQQKNAFQAIISNAIPDEEKGTKVLLDIQEELSQIVEEQAEFVSSTDEVPRLTRTTVQELLTDKGLPEEITTKIERAIEESFQEEPPVEYLIDTKLLAEKEKRRKELELEEQVQRLQAKLEETTQSMIAASTLEHTTDEGTLAEADIVLKVKPQKVDQIVTQMIDGKKCIVIPLEEDEQINVNGIHKEVADVTE